MASDAAQMQMEVERRMRDIGARFGSLPDAGDELLRLIEETDTWLSRVDQSPPERMHSTLRPTMSALIKKELLDHTDPDVKLAVVSCLTEVTRITAPEAPYDDDVMRVSIILRMKWRHLCTEYRPLLLAWFQDVFTRVVEAFGKLDDTKSPSFARRVSMLETVAKVRSCVLMLDLDCDDLIRDTFHHFFRTISPTHQENVIASMETIMMFVIEESEPVHPDLASCLLQNVKKDKKETLPESFGLAEKVIGLCSKKLKPAFIQLLQGTPLNEYSEVVTSLLQDSSDTGGDNNVDASGKETESSKLEQDGNCPGQDGTPPNSTPTTALSNGGAPVDNVKSPNGPASSEQKPQLSSDDKQAKVSDELISGDKEVPEPVKTEPEKPSDLNSKKSHKLESSTDSEVPECSKVVNDNEGLVASGELSPETNDGDNKLPSESGNRAAGDTSKPVDSTPGVVKPKRGRPPAAKSQEKKPVGKSQGSGLESNKVGLVSNSGGRATRRLAKDDIKSSSRKTGEGESSKKQQKASLKLQKEDTLSDEDTDEDLSLKEIVSPKSLTKAGKTKGQPGDSGGSKRKHVQEAEEVPQSKKSKALDGSLVGSRIKVWWPDDKKFYDGVVKSFDASSKKHRIVYDDGDVEQLLLTDEKWEFLVEEQSSNSDAASDMPRGTRGKRSSGQQTKDGETETPNSDKQRSIDGSDLPKKRGRPKGVRSSNSMSNNDSPVTPARLKGKSVERDAEETPKTGSRLKNEGGRLSRSTAKTKDDLLKASNKDEAGITKSGRKSKDETGSKHKDSKDETKSSESNPKDASTPKAADGSKTNGLSTKRKATKKEDESSEKEEQGSAKTSTGKKRRRKIRN